MASCVGPSWGQHQGRNGPQQKGAQVPPSCGYRLSSPCECTQGRHRHGTRPHEALNGEIKKGEGDLMLLSKPFLSWGLLAPPPRNPRAHKARSPTTGSQLHAGPDLDVLTPRPGGEPWGPPKVAKHNMFCGPAMLPCTQPPRPACAPQACQGMATLTGAAKSQTNTPLGRKPCGCQFCKDPGQIY